MATAKKEPRRRAIGPSKTEKKAIAKANRLDNKRNQMASRMATTGRLLTGQMARAGGAYVGGRMGADADVRGYNVGIPSLLLGGAIQVAAPESYIARAVGGGLEGFGLAEVVRKGERDAGS